MGIKYEFVLSNEQKISLVTDYSALHDAVLINKSVDGDKMAFGALVARYEKTVATTVIGILGPGDDAEDVGQSVFIRFHKAMKDFRGDSALSTYLTRIAINLSLNELKRRKHKSMFFSISAPVAGETDIKDETDEGNDVDNREVVAKALQELDDKFKSVVVLRMLQGYSTRETAEILNLPQGTVLSRLARAQEKLKDLLKHLIE